MEKAVARTHADRRGELLWFPRSSWPSPRWSALTLLILAATLASSALGALAAQRYMRFDPNVPYDGRFTFARIRYPVYRRSGWEFDYPTMERHLMTMIREVTSLKPHMTGSNIHTFDDPELLEYPVACLSEPGYCCLTRESTGSTCRIRSSTPSFTSRRWR